MPPPDRDKLRAGLSSLLSGDALPEAPARAPERRSERLGPDDPTTDTGNASNARQSGSQEHSGRRAATEARGETDEDTSGHVRTSTGYVREGGERVHRVSVMLTRDERRRLREQADDAGLSVTDLVRRALKL